MKKLNYLLIAALAASFASCSQDDIGILPGQRDGNVHFTINLPSEFATRTIGDGLSATNLSALVYDVDNSASSPSYTYLLTNTATFAATSYTTTVDLELVAGKDYMVVFFASNSSATSVYSIDNASGKLTANYANMTNAANLTDAYDCFYGTYSINNLSTGGSLTANVTLTRPVAQINWGTIAVNAENSNYESIFGTDGAYLQSSLAVTNAYTTLDLLTGEYGGEASATLVDFQAPDATFPVTGTSTTYQYVAMQYLLAPSTTSATYDLTLTVKNNGGDNTNGTYSNEVPVASAPVQANYQTNIYGAILTSSANITVTKSQNWDGSHNYPLVWDGSVTYPSIPESNTTPVQINRPSDLAGLAEMVSGNATNEDGSPMEANDFDGFTIQLADDFDMGNVDFPGLGAVSRNGNSASGTSFKGVFDGQNHTISNLKIAGTDSPTDAVGFIGNLDGSDAQLKDVTFDNLVIDAPNNEQAGVVGLVTNGATVSGVTVSSGSVSSAEAAGGIVGRVMLSGTVTQCENSATISTSKNAGGIVGAAYYSADGSTMTISECKNHGAVNGTSQAVAGIVGLSAADVTNCTNDGTITGTGSSAVGGIVGQQNYAGSVTGCTNTGNVIGGTLSSNYGAGGIVGWVRYSGSTAQNYSRQNVISVNKNNNSGNVSGQTGVGGIVGMWYTCGECNYNTNTAKSLVANGSFVAGIIGGQQWTETPPTLAPDDENIDTLYVNYNYSSTTEDQMTGGGKNLYVYVNSPENVSQTGNSNTDPGVVNTQAN